MSNKRKRLNANDDDEPPAVPCDAWCSSDLSKITSVTRPSSKGTLVWIIKGFRDHWEKCDLWTRLTSEEFTLTDPDGNDTKWVLDLYPNGGKSSFCGNTYLRSLNASSVSTGIETYFLDGRGGERRFLTSCPFVFGAGNPNQVRLSQFYFTNLGILFDDGNLTLVCKLTIDGGKIISCGAKKSKPDLMTSHQQISENLKSFLLAKEFSDVQIKCGDETFDAHQVILSARSPVFGRMFQSEMTEKKSQLVDIEELDPKIVLEMLKFIYTGSCAVTEEDPDLELAADVLVAANRYELNLLKNMCECVLASELTAENCLKVRSFLAI